MAECKSAVEEAGGNVEKALEVLQKRGTTRSVSGARVAAEGLVHVYVHTGSKLAVLVEVNCETDFVARTPEFKAFCEGVAMQIAGMNPKYVSRNQIPAEDIARQRDIFTESSRTVGQPPERLAKIVEGKVNKWFAEVCLLDQKAVLDTDPWASKTIEDVRAAVSANFRERITIRRFIRWEVGEGMEKRSNNLVSEVASAIEASKG
jgi:elongation factor Ts